VVGDTIINGQTFTHYEGTYFGNPNLLDKFSRDSSGYIVNVNGNIKYS